MKRTYLISILTLVILTSTGPIGAVMLLGTAQEKNGGDIYEINTDDGTITLLFDIPDEPEWKLNDSPNGNAFDEDSGRFYFTSFTDPGSPANSSSGSNLYFVDLLSSSPTIVYAGLLEGQASNATFHEDAYWYISHGTNDIQKVTFHENGSVNLDTFMTTVKHDKPGYLIFGDIAFANDGVLYLTGAVKHQGTNYKQSISGVIDVTNGDFIEIGSALYWGQIAFGDDGWLYGNNGTGDVFRINTASGKTKYVFTARVFTDLATYSKGKHQRPNKYQ